MTIFGGNTYGLLVIQPLAYGAGDDCFHAGVIWKVALIENWHR
jgi:hypothetical protein